MSLLILILILIRIRSNSLNPSRWKNNVQEDFFALGNGYLCASVTLQYFLLGTPWNFIVILVILYKRMWLASSSVMFLLNLVISNFLVCVIVFSFIIINQMNIFLDK